MPDLPGRRAPSSRPTAVALAAAVALLAAACGGGGKGAAASGAATSSASSAASLPDTVRATVPGLYPEGVEYDSVHGRFLLSSLSHGTVTAVDDRGASTTLVDDSGNVSSVGLQVAGARLLVALSDVRAAFDTTVAGRAALGIYDLASGRRLHRVDLGGLFPNGRHFANDIAVDADGNAYITDSLSPVIYRVTPDGKASIFVRDTLLGGHGFGMNGIDYDPRGFLLVAMDQRRALYRIPVAAPDSLARVRLSEPLSADGMVLGPDGRLVAVAATYPGGGPRREELVELSSDDGWHSATIVARAPLDASASPTTVALRRGAAYVVLAHLSGLGQAEPVRSFEIVRVPLSAGDGTGG
jgi:sugar lactone lactonase YvrE